MLCLLQKPVSHTAVEESDFGKGKRFREKDDLTAPLLPLFFFLRAMLLLYVVLCESTKNR